jgi:RNA polymerase sigma factor (sigma-70 family)
MTTAGIDTILSTAHRAYLVRLCAAITGAPHAAEDLAQEALLEAWRHQEKLVDPAGADRWLAAIARNVCRRWLRRQSLEAVHVVPNGSASDLPDRAGSESSGDRIELRAVLDSALATLPSTTRDVLIHRYIHDDSHADIGNRLGLSTEATAMRASRGRVALRQLQDWQLLMTDGQLERGPAGNEGWLRTPTWCSTCGGSTLVMRHDLTSSTVSFRCPGCSPEPTEASHAYQLSVPLFARVLGDLTRPEQALSRAVEWSWEYFQTGIESGRVACTRCGHHPIQLLPYARGAGSRSHRGIHAECSRCAHVVCTSTHGMALASPAARTFLRRRPRARMVSTHDVNHHGAVATRVVIADAPGTPALEIVVAAGSLRLLRSRLVTTPSA